MINSNKYDKYNNFQYMAKVISYIESGKLSTPFDRLQGIGIFILLDTGFTFDEIKTIKLNNYNNDIIELPNVISLMVNSKHLWDHFKEQKRYGENLINPDIMHAIGNSGFKTE